MSSLSPSSPPPPLSWGNELPFSGKESKGEEKVGQRKSLLSLHPPPSWRFLALLFFSSLDSILSLSLSLERGKKKFTQKEKKFRGQRKSKVRKRLPA